MNKSNDPRKPRGVFVQDPQLFPQIYGPDEQAEIAEKIKVCGGLIPPNEIASHTSDLRAAELLFTGWGPPNLDRLLPLMPQLKVIFYAGGATQALLHPELWERNILLTSSYAANAIPVAEYTLAAIILGLKHGWSAMMNFKLFHRYHRPDSAIGAYHSNVGLISCGVIAREVLRLLKAFDVKVYVFDPYLSAEEIHALGATPADLDDIFSVCDVVSVHTPELEETRGMIGASHFAQMKSGATFINTARGAIVRESELHAAALMRPDLQFVLDVISPEPPAPKSPLFQLPNVIVTPHIAGAMGGECRRLGRYMVDELHRYLSDEPLRWLITPSLAATSSHRPSFMPPPSLICDTSFNASPTKIAQCAGQR
jgi:phosphoglycerate dehydrogenase-like enzyme